MNMYHGHWLQKLICLIHSYFRHILFIFNSLTLLFKYHSFIHSSSSSGAKYKRLSYIISYIHPSKAKKKTLGDVKKHLSRSPFSNSSSKRAVNGGSIFAASPFLWRQNDDMMIRVVPWRFRSMHNYTNIQLERVTGREWEGTWLPTSPLRPIWARTTTHVCLGALGSNTKCTLPVGHVHSYIGIEGHSYSTLLLDARRFPESRSFYTFHIQTNQTIFTVLWTAHKLETFHLYKNTATFS